MNVSENELREFITPFYSDKDIMHNLWHIELVLKAVKKIIALGNYAPDEECLILATCFHGFVYRAEDEIREWLTAHGYTCAQAEKAIEIAWESQRSEVPETLEGKILHDAHVLEGGRTYLVVKTLITGSVRGQTLEQTLAYMKEHVLGTNRCFLPETIPLCEEMNRYADEFYRELCEGIS